MECCTVAEPILLVDDDESYRAILGHYLEGLGYAVLEAADGATAYDMASKRPISLMVLDIVMPNAEGLGTIRRLRREGYSTKILAVSGTSEARGYLRIASYLGADANIEKIRPISELLTLIQSLLGRPGPNGGCSKLQESGSSPPKVCADEEHAVAAINCAMVADK